MYTSFLEDFDEYEYISTVLKYRVRSLSIISKICMKSSSMADPHVETAVFSGQRNSHFDGSIHNTACVSAPRSHRLIKCHTCGVESWC